MSVQPTLLQAVDDPTLLVGTVWRTKPGPDVRRMVVVAPGRKEYGEQKMITRNVETRRLSTVNVSRIFSNYIYEGMARNVHH